MKKILLLIDYSSEFSRRLLKGLTEYTKGKKDWILYRIPPHYKTLFGQARIYNWAKEWNADAIISQWNQVQFDILKDLNIPVFLQNYKEANEYFSYITGGYIETGKLAANFFIRRGYKNFAFYGYSGFKWSKERSLGFRNEIHRIGGNFLFLESADLNQTQRSRTNRELDTWLLSLPKPIALFACDDNFAIQISEACKANNIKIPEDISLLGVDNDELICNLSDPPISSIVLNIESGGYEIGRRIDQLMFHHNSEPFNVSIDPIYIERRESTGHFSIKDRYIIQAVNYIEDNFKNDYTIDQLTNLVPLSRRSLEIKFKEETGISIYNFILSRRMEYFIKLLITTDKEVYEIAMESGFNDHKNAVRYFKITQGYTPLEFRKKYRNLPIDD